MLEIVNTSDGEIEIVQGSIGDESEIQEIVEPDQDLSLLFTVKHYVTYTIGNQKVTIFFKRLDPATLILTHGGPLLIQASQDAAGLAADEDLSKEDIGISIISSAKEADSVAFEKEWSELTNKALKLAIFAKESGIKDLDYFVEHLDDIYKSDLYSRVQGGIASNTLAQKSPKRTRKKRT